MRDTRVKCVALGGILAAVAVVIMSVGGLIPVATFVCPMLCCIMAHIVNSICGSQIAWAWYGAVTILSALFCSDKEAVAIYLFLGYYPIIRPWFHRRRHGFVLKLLYFNGSVAALYWILISLIGMSQIAAEYQGFGVIGLVILVIIGNAVFCLLDKLLLRLSRMW